MISVMVQTKNNQIVLVVNSKPWV